MTKKALPVENSDSNEQLALIARLYYVDGLGQSEVAKLAGVSQAKISRLLSLAKERGIVRISVTEYEPRVQSLEAELKKRFSLDPAIVIKVPEGNQDDKLRETVGYFGAPVIHGQLLANPVVAIAGGRTMEALIRNLPTTEAESMSVVQAMGNVDSILLPFDAQEIGRVTAQRMGGTFVSLNTPAFISEKRTRDALLNLEQVQNVQETWSRSKIALVGIGTLDNSVFVERGTLTRSMHRELLNAGAVGELCGRFIDANGKEIQTQWRDCVVSIAIEQIKKIPLVLAVVSGSDRSEAIHAAIRGELIQGLLIDEHGARSLLEFDRTMVATNKTSAIPNRPARKKATR
ncbi:MAG: sugar-binding domain-containing protein [Pirellulaceae bacterium]|nr:sugar-binding domain-containing protein [Pirellulaceae bacterium]